MYAEWCRLIGQAKINGKQEKLPTPVPSDEDDEEMTLDEARLVRRFRKGRRPATGVRAGSSIRGKVPG
jgi:hypothetical protein